MMEDAKDLTELQRLQVRYSKLLTIARDIVKDFGDFSDSVGDAYPAKSMRTMLVNTYKMLLERMTSYE